MWWGEQQPAYILREMVISLLKYVFEICWHLSEFPKPEEREIKSAVYNRGDSAYLYLGAQENSLIKDWWAAKSMTHWMVWGRHLILKCGLMISICIEKASLASCSSILDMLCVNLESSFIMGVWTLLICSIISLKSSYYITAAFE